MTARQLPRFHVGPMSLHTVDAAIAVAYRHNAPLCLIGTRRQVECAAQGGGYVNNWTTESFSEYVRARDPQNLIVLARDHGGPYQRGAEQGLPLDQAMQLAQDSFATDILSGFKVIHLDPEKAIDRAAPQAKQQLAEMSLQMLTRADRFAKSQGITDVVFEAGTDETVGEDLTPQQWDQFLDHVMNGAAAAQANLPISFAVPMGTKVKETRNVGDIAQGTNRVQLWEDRIMQLRDIAARYNVILKLHNSDYVSRDVIDHYLRLGVRCMNVAPEFGVVESRRLMQLLNEHDLPQLVDGFQAEALASGRWGRWLVPNSTATDEDKALMAGHYVFSEPPVAAIKTQATAALAARGVDLAAELQRAVEGAIEHYLLPLIGAEENDVRNQRTA